MMQKSLLMCGVALIALVAASAVVAAPLATPFLSVDINGYNAGGGQAKGPTLAGFEDFEGGEGLGLDPAVNWGASGATGLTNTYATSEGNITATVIGVGASLGARERGANAGGQIDLYRDFVFAQRNNADGFGRNYIKLELSGLVPGQRYEVTGYAREPAFDVNGGNNPLTSYQAWTTIGALGGLDGPAAFLDSMAVGSSYQPVFVDHDMDANTPVQNTGYKNPIPSFRRTQVSGPDALSGSDPYVHSASLYPVADGAGTVTIYTWADPNGFGPNVQGASLLNGFEVGLIPEPTSAVLLIAALLGVAGGWRRIR